MAMKPAPLSEADLLAWIADGTEEGHQVEYKRAASLGTDSDHKAEIAKDVSAMANSAGGLLFYGVSEEKHLPTGIDPIVDPKMTKEWLEQVINTGIHPRIVDLRIHPIRVAKPTAGSVYVVEIPEGTTAHQAVERKLYYRRFNFESQAMHDREIRDVMGRQRDPMVDVTTSLSVGQEASLMGYRRSTADYRWLELGLKNVGARLAREVRAFAYIPWALLDEPEKMIPAPQRQDTPRGPIAVVRFTNKCVDGDGPFGMPMKIDGPLLPGLSLSVTTIRLISTDTPLPDETRIVMQVYADEAQVRTAVIDFRDLVPESE